MLCWKMTFLAHKENHYEKQSAIRIDFTSSK
jgi:hypothetical protein